MVARMLSMGVAIGLANLVSMGFAPLSVAQAASPTWSAYAAPVKRPQFRPWQRSERPAPKARWRPTIAVGQNRAMVVEKRRPAPGGAWVQSSRSLDTPGLRSEGRYASQRLLPPSPGTRFRPESQQAGTGGSDAPQHLPVDTRRSALQAQFRPAERKRKQTYEQMHAAEGSQNHPFMAPLVAYGMPRLATPPIYGGYWRGW